MESNNVMVVLLKRKLFNTLMALNTQLGHRFRFLLAPKVLPQNF